MAQFHYQIGDASKTVRVEREGAAFAVTIDEQRYTVHVQPGVAGRLHLAIDGERATAFVATGERTDPMRYIWLNGASWAAHRVTAARRRHRPGQPAATGNITAPMPGQILELFVTVGATVTQGDPLLVLSAMKMENRLIAPQTGVVTTVDCTVGETVQRGQRLVQLTPFTAPATP
ncbi:MAG: biotin/lipoyl-containing protein [Caldilineaceae bacterium]